jgi:hypothetical protein
MKNEVKINVPEGYAIDKENSTFECIKFKPIENELPRTWEEFCESHPIKYKECYLRSNDIVSTTCAEYKSLSKRLSSDTGYLPNKEIAKAMLALCQLIQLRDCYNDGWIPDWSKTNPTKVWWNISDISKYTIYFNENRITCGLETSRQQILAFKTAEIRDQFLENFRDLIETAKPLL